jgi:hypothetical protein
MQLGSSTHRRILIALTAAMLVALAVPALASARITVPPGATEGDQYFEEVPNGGGSASPNQGGTNNAGGRGEGSQSVAATQALNALGKDGQAAAALANANRAPQGPTQSSGDQRPSSSTQGEGGMGFWFPLLLIITALAAAAYGLRRRLNPA